MIFYKHIYVLSLLVTSVFSFSHAQEPSWITFEELDKQFTKSPKKVIIHFYADWCVYCRKMENVVYSKPQINAILEDEYYVVKFNVESTDTITFGGEVFKNENAENTRNAYHQIPKFLAGRKNEQLELPATVILDQDFNIIKRYYRYISPKEMLTILTKT